jgi:hypothetical protein
MGVNTMADVSEELAARVCPCAAAVAGRVYPVPRPAGPVDDRFSAAVVREVGDVLAGYGFPAIEDDSPDWYALSWCLWRFVYGYAGRGRHGSDPAGVLPDSSAGDSAGSDGAAC